MNQLQTIEQESLNQFRVSLLLAILLSASMGALSVGIISVLGFFNFEMHYVLALFGYSVGTLCVYGLLKTNKQYYTTAMYVGIFSSIVLFALMLLSVVNDELRLVWFFLVAFSAFILGRKRFGLVVTLIIVFIVIVLYLFGNIGLSLYALLTFMTALFMFTLFAFYFLKKIELDSELLKHRVAEEVAKQQAQEQVMLRKYRMASMGEMIDAIAHQWRQPLAQANMILLTIDDSVEEDKIDKTTLSKHLTELFALTAHMSKTIDDFRTLLAINKPRETFNVEECIEEVLALMKGNLKGVNVEVNLTNKTKITTHKNELSQVLITLLSNSIEALHAKGIEGKHVAINIKEPSNNISIEVEDNAGGIPKGIEDKIFDPYFTTKKSDGGTGLGLYIVKMIVEGSMQGNISQEKGKEGAKFSIVLKREV